MKKINFSKIALTAVLAVSLYSCREEMVQQDSAENKVVITDATVKNGRLYFPNKENLQNTFKSLKDVPENEVIKYLPDKEFSSLRPVITEKNETEVIAEMVNRKKTFLKQKTGKISSESNGTTNEDLIDDLDDMEEIVGDDVYAAMLNGDAEIQVANDVYKYTDVGLFVTPVENYSELENYLEVKNISDNLLVPTDDNTKEEFIADKTEGQLIALEGDINYFISTSKIIPNDDGGGGSGSTGPYNLPVTSPAEDLPSIINNLKIGDVRKPWLGNIFGTTWETDDKYESRRRVKVKFYSQNLWLVYLVGCKVKHQYKGWTGLWRSENADKLGIGVNSIKWTFSHAINYAEGIPRQVYWLDGKMYKSSNGTDYTVTKNAPIPSLPFSQNAKVDAVIQFSSNLSGLSEDQLNKLFWDTAWKQANKFLEGQNKKLNRIAFITDSFSQSYVQYYDFSQIEDNQDTLERTFDFGIATPQFTYTFGGGVGNGFTVTSYKFDFLQATATAVNLYGIAKKNGAWHGVKLIAK
jgi:hypothetical protein